VTFELENQHHRGHGFGPEAGAYHQRVDVHGIKADGI